MNWKWPSTPENNLKTWYQIIRSFIGATGFFPCFILCVFFVFIAEGWYSAKELWRTVI